MQYLCPKQIFLFKTTQKKRKCRKLIASFKFFKKVVLTFDYN